MDPILNRNSGLLEFGFHFTELENPNLFRNMYPYNEIPRLIFNHRIVPMNLPEQIYITDTTFRDGQQARSPYSVEEVCHLFDFLHKLDNGAGIIRQCEFFLYSEKNREAVRRCQEKGYQFPEITSWIRARVEDFQLVKEMGVKETGILVSCSDYHIFKKMKWKRSEAITNYLKVVVAALEAGVRPRCHFEDITRADFFGFVLPFASKLMELSKESGIPIKIRACDTLGLGTSLPGVVLPRSVQQIMYGLTNYSGVPSELIEWHGHNDFYNAVPNAVTAWLYGSAAVNTSLLGIGERTGNTPLEAMVIEYCQIKGNTGGMNLKVITEIAEYFENSLNYEIPPRTPFVGRAFNATRAGIHADGLMKDEEIYNIFNTTDILGRPPIVVVDSTSGLAGIAAWINTYYSLSDADKIDKRDPRVVRIREWVDAEYATGRNTVIGDAELENQVHLHLHELLTLRESRSE
ncbi:MAG: 2-isopropylmalate synthase [Oscillospiraceae bacterium]|nr:2-isopropylmalate synthase [Oscillospiraceae bacterium]